MVQAAAVFTSIPLQRLQLVLQLNWITPTEALSPKHTAALHSLATFACSFRCENDMTFFIARTANMKPDSCSVFET